MSCISDIILGGKVIFGICTHNPDSGSLNNASSPPIYRVYDESLNIITTGIMVRVDSENTTALYSGSFDGTIENGFDVGVYTIYIEAIVIGITGGITYTFTIKSASLQMAIKREVALDNFMFFMVKSLDHVSGATGRTVTAERSIDGSAFESCYNTPSECSAGWYKINLAVSDLSGAIIALKFTSPGADPCCLTIFTQE
jgi:hypothetical protein